MLNIDKAIETIEHLLAWNGGNMLYDRLGYLLYIIERHHLTNYRYNFLGDELVCLNGLPVLATILDYCRHAKANDLWDNAFYCDGLRLCSRSGVDTIVYCTENEISAVRKIYSNYKGCDTDYMIEILRNLPELSQKERDGRYVIARVDILRAVGVLEAEARSLFPDI